MRVPNIFDRNRERVEAINADRKHCYVVIRPSTANYHADARKPFALYSRRGDYIARYGTIERAEAAALAYDASVYIALGQR